MCSCVVVSVAFSFAIFRFLFNNYLFHHFSVFGSFLNLGHVGHLPCVVQTKASTRFERRQADREGSIYKKRKKENYQKECKWRVMSVEIGEKERAEIARAISGK